VNHRVQETAAARQAAQRHKSRQPAQQQKYPESLSRGDISDQPFLDWERRSDFSIRDFIQPAKLRTAAGAVGDFVAEYWRKLVIAAALLLVIGLGGATLTNPAQPQLADGQPAESVVSANDSESRQVPSTVPTGVQLGGVNADAVAVEPVTISDDYQLELPINKKAFGWYDQSGGIGDNSKSTVINSGPAYSKQLKALSKGDVVTVVGGDESVKYQISSVETAKDYNFLISEALKPAKSGQGGLTMVLYHGQMTENGVYPERLVISATTLAD